jgi:hypothetical protein
MPVNVKTTATKPESVSWFRIHRQNVPELQHLSDFDAWTMQQNGFVSFSKSEINENVTEEILVFQDTEAYTNFQKQRETHETFVARRNYNIANQIKSVVEVSVS